MGPTDPTLSTTDDDNSNLTLLYIFFLKCAYMLSDIKEIFVNSTK